MMRRLRVGLLVFAMMAGAGRAGEANLLANGGFEQSGKVLPSRLAAAVKQGLKFEGEDPALPMRWDLNGAAGVDVRLVADAHGGRQALQSVGGRLDMTMGLVEVVPGGTYSFGGWSKGKGRGWIRIHGMAYEGAKQLAAVRLTNSVEWSESRWTLAIPGNIRKVSFQIFLEEGAWILDDVYLKTVVDEPFDIDDLLGKKATADAHTVCFVDFDGQGAYRAESGAEVTEAGRFGKGLRLERAKVSTAIVPLSVKRMPEEGTLEFWFAPDDDAAHIYEFLNVMAGGQDVMRLSAGTDAALRAAWRISGGLYDKQHSIGLSSRTSRAWFRPGQWHHIALQWDTEAVRYYVNGVLVDYSTAKPQPFFATPSALRFGPRYSHTAWSGSIDEIRLSDIQRYGPVIPAGVKWTPLVVAAPPPAAAPAEKTAPPPDYARERATLLAPLPEPPDGARVFGADRMRPLVQDDAYFKSWTNGLPVGLPAVRIGYWPMSIYDPNNDGGYWKLSDLPAGRYVIGVWYQAGKAGNETPSIPLCVYLNGRVVQLSTGSDTVQVAPGIYCAEAQAAAAELLKEGDEVAVLSGRGNPIRVMRLVLHTAEPARGRNWMFESYGGNYFLRTTALQLNLDCAFVDSSGKWPAGGDFRQEQTMGAPKWLKRTPDGARAVALCRIANPLSVPLTVEYTASVKAYYREVVGTDKATLTLQPHERVTREIAFDVIPDSRRYTIEADARAVNPPDLGWPAADTISFFPGVRQNVPWPEPFVARDERAVVFTGVLPGDRVEYSLNGQWESAFTTSLTPPMPAPDGLEWKPRSVPIPNYACQIGGLNPRPHGMYVRRTFVAPALQEGRTWRLTLADAIDEATLYVNGKKVGNVRGARTPVVCDVTEALRPGTNEVVIVVRDVLAIMNPAYVNPAAPVPSNQYLDAPGGFGNNLALGDVTLSASPEVAADDAQVITSVRRNSITARCGLTSHAAAPVKVRVNGRVLDAGTPVLELGTLELDLQPGATAPVRFEKPWKNPVLWGPGSPKLYTLAVETTDAASGTRLDLMRQRFGFRESWIENGRIYFNGAPARFKASTVHGGQGVIRADDVQLSRGARLPDFLDEFGYLATFQLAAIFNSSSRHNVERDAFWESARKNVLAGLALRGRHPCIIAWDLSNEWLSFLDYGGGDPMAGARRFKTLADTLSAADPSRWIFFNGDEDLHGLHDTYSTHYMLESANPHPISRFGFRGHSNYFPDGGFFRPLDQTFTNGQVLVINSHRGTTYRYGSKPLMNTENLWKTGAYMPPGPSKFVGEDDVLSPAIDSGRGPIVWMWKQNIDGHRDLGVSAVFNYTPVCGVGRRGHMIQCFIMPEHTHHYVAGEKVDRAYSLHNDRFVPADFELRWNLLDPQGRTVREGRDSRRMDSGDLQRGALSFELPDVKARTTYMLKLDLLADGKLAYGEERDLDVFPKAPPAVVAGPRRVFLFDPAGTTAAAFKKAGMAFESLSDLSAPPGDAASAVLVIGENALTPTLPNSHTPTLSAYVAAGGRVLVLAQDRLLPGLPVRTSLETREWSSMPFVRTPQHPVFAGLPSAGVNSRFEIRDSKRPITSWDLHFWKPAHVSAAGAYSKPEGGPAVVLVDSGTDTGLEWAQMMECYRGQGSYLLCQLPLAGAYDQEPMAREMLAATVRYLTAVEAFRAPGRELQLVLNPPSGAGERLRDLGVACRVVQPEAALASGDVRLIDAAGFTNALPLPAAGVLEAGATLIVHGARPEHEAALAALAGRPVRLTVQPFATWEGRGYRAGYTPLTAGLSHIDLYWKNYDGWEGAHNQAENPKLKIEDLVVWSAAGEGAIEHVFPGGLVEIPVGKGRLILDQMRWETDHRKLQGLSARVVTALMLGLDVRVEPYTPPRSLPATVAYEPVDLALVANRGFADPVGEDGKGGWSDQGPKLDLKAFPTGRQMFGGVPFLIGQEPRGCVVLRSSARPYPELMPEEAIIPLGYPVEGLWFLHGVTYSGNGPVGLYQVQYADGTTHDIPLIGNENIRDWIAAPGPFARERGTVSRVAWTGSTEIFPVVSVYQMLWVNPNPGVPVRAVRFANPDKAGCPILIGLTAAVASKGVALKPTADQAEARALLAKGLAALGAGSDAEARALFEQAVQKDPTMEAAYQALGQVCEKLKDEAGAMAAYRAWTESGAHSPLPYNKIGEALERKQDYPGALEAYTRSLEIEWNQPPAIEAKSRLQKLVTH